MTCSFRKWGGDSISYRIEWVTRLTGTHPFDILNLHPQKSLYAISRAMKREILKEDLKTVIEKEQNAKSRILALLNIPPDARLSRPEDRNQPEAVPAFHHAVERDVVRSDKRLFIMERKYEKTRTATVINVSNETVRLPEYEGKRDLMGDSRFDGNVRPYGIYFLE